MDNFFINASSLETLPKTSTATLWPYFSKAYASITHHAATSFRFEPGRAPMATTKEVLIALITYYTVIFGGRELMRGREPFKLNGLFKIHNFYLTTISAALLVLHLEQIVPTVLDRGIFNGVCRRNAGWTPQLEILYYLNYLTKYLELLDTVFLVLKKKPLTFLHTYHHGATALLCYTQLRGRTPVSWVPITLNLGVHVVMYWYYFQAARGIKIWWKKYITILQIIQFVIDLGFIYFAFYTEITSSVWAWMNLPTAGHCEGEHFAAWWGAGIITSYLFLFIGFYLATYKKAQPKQRKSVVTANGITAPLGIDSKAPISNGHAIGGRQRQNGAAVKST